MVASFLVVCDLLMLLCGLFFFAFFLSVMMSCILWMTVLNEISQSEYFKKKKKTGFEINSI